MPVSKLKNIIILVLLLADLILLGLLVPHQLTQERERYELRQSLSDLYETGGIRLAPEAIPKAVPLYAIQLAENSSDQLRAAKALLGEQMVAEADSTRHLSSFQSRLGTCSMGRDGSFRAELKEVPAKTAMQTLEEMGFQWQKLSEAAAMTDEKEQITATQSVLGVPVFSGGLTMTFAHGQLTAVDGSFFFGTSEPVRVSKESCISEADALIAFLAARYELGWVGEEIYSMEQGYLRSETASASAVQLTPVWCLKTDSGTFYIDGLTGEVTVGNVFS